MILPPHSSKFANWTHFDGWITPASNQTEFAFTSAVCFLFAKYMSDLLLSETGKLRHFGLISASPGGHPMANFAPDEAIQCVASNDGPYIVQ